jgi:hypothetical protein
MRSHDLALRLVLAAASLACGTAPPTPPARAQPAPEAAAAPGQRTTLALSPLGDLVEQWTAAPGNLFLRRPRPDFEQYETIRVEMPAVYYSEGVTPPIPSDTVRLKKAFRAAMAEELGPATGLPVSDRRGPHVLVILSEASNVDLDRNRNGLGQSRVTSIIQPSGNVFFVVEVADDATGTPLVRFAMRRPLPGGIFTGPWWPELDRARQLFLQFAQDAGNGLGVVFGTGEETASDSG